MPPALRMYLVRRVADGTMRTILAHSTRGAMREFVSRFNPPKGEEFWVKERGGSSDWEAYKVA